MKHLIIFENYCELTKSSNKKIGDIIFRLDILIKSLNKTDAKKIILDDELSKKIILDRIKDLIMKGFKEFEEYNDSYKKLLYYLEVYMKNR
jgi:hypothetical protein